MDTNPERRSTARLSGAGFDEGAIALPQAFWFRKNVAPTAQVPMRAAFVRECLKEEAINELWFKGAGGGFVSFVFPIILGSKEISGWDQLTKENEVPVGQRAEVLRTLKTRRCAAMLKRLESFNFSAETMSAALEDQLSAIGKYHAQLKKDIAESPSESDEAEYRAWTEIIEERQDHIYRISEEEERLCQELYMDDAEVQEALKSITGEYTPTAPNSAGLPTKSAEQQQQQQR